MRILNVTKGERYGKLLVIEEVFPTPLIIYNSGKRAYVRMVKCQCDCGNIKDVRMSSLISGRVKSCGCNNNGLSNVRKTLVCGVGRNDISEPIRDGRKNKPFYRIWLSMIYRCYTSNSGSHNATYQNCYVCDEWLYLSNFKKWFDDNYVEGYHLDKDILVKGNKTYSPDTCCFVPPIVNSLAIRNHSHRGKCPVGVYYKKADKCFVATMRYRGVLVTVCRSSSMDEAFEAYKIAKEKYIKAIADECYSNGEISTIIHEALLRMKINKRD